MHTRLTTALLLALALPLSGCSTLPTAGADAAIATGTTADATEAAADAAGAVTAPTGADDNLNAVLWVQQSTEYVAAAQTVYRAATSRLDAALKQRDWDALVPEERGATANARRLKPAVVLDIDETVLDNSPYQARLVAEGGEYDEVTWSAWVEERRAKPVPGVVEFAKAANAKGVTLVYISNRAQHLQDATIDNLRAVGLPVKDESVFLGLGTVVDGCEQEGSEKRCRRLQAGRDYRVLMQFGDQLGDFVEVVANTPDARATLLTQYGGWFGERWWMLPNPTYGSWEPALFNNAWSEPRDVRRTLKRENLILSK